MAIQISDDFMTLEVNRAVIAADWFSQHAAADGNGARIVSSHLAQLLNRSQAITTLTLVDRLAVGLGGDDPLVKPWRVELFL